MMIVLGLVFGYQMAHQRIASECEKLGGFYIGDRIFKCEKIESTNTIINVED